MLNRIRSTFKFNLNSVLMLVLTFFLLLLPSCHKSENHAKTPLKYNLIELKQNVGFENEETIDIDSIYNYYYIEINLENKEMKVVLGKKSDNVHSETLGSYTESDNMYISSIDGITMNYIILDNGNRLECTFFFIYSLYELEK